VPNIPTSPLIRDLQAAGQSMPPDAIVVRGYVGPPSDVLEEANRILGAHGKTLIDIADIAAVRTNSGAMLPVVNGPWRIYLSARLDTWIEVEDWGRDVLRCVAETNTDRTDAYTVWLRSRDPDRCCAICYRIVTVSEICKDDGFVAGRLVQDYMSRDESSNVVWDEQQFGPTSGKPTKTNCF
jgi:hypothetical protein